MTDETSVVARTGIKLSALHGHQRAWTGTNQRWNDPLILYQTFWISNMRKRSTPGPACNHSVAFGVSLVPLM